MLALCQHNTLTYYAFYYADLFDAGLILFNYVQNEGLWEMLIFRFTFLM